MNINSSLLCAPPQEECQAYPADDIREMVARCIEEYCGRGAVSLSYASPESFATASFWEDAGVSPPPGIAYLIELLHRAYLQGN